MPRYFIEVAYNGSRYSGFQIQQNGITIQGEVEKALNIYYKRNFSLTGASRTDAGVHSLQNYFHFDSEEDLETIRSIYNLNAILPDDIVIKRIYPVPSEAHCRFDATYRQYQYFIYQDKDPFLQGRAYYYPYTLDMDTLNEAAGILKGAHDFAAFSKKNTQVNNFMCNVMDSQWFREKNQIIYQVKANRFLRGMVKGLVGTQLQAGTGKISHEAFAAILQSGDCARANFSVPAEALYLMEVNYKKDYE